MYKFFRENIFIRNSRTRSIALILVEIFDIHCYHGPLHEYVAGSDELIRKPFSSEYEKLTMLRHQFI